MDIIYYWKSRVGIEDDPLGKLCPPSYNRCMRFFNTAGPCRPEDHYMLFPVERLGASVNVQRLIEQKAYFVLHAPRQTGKTTTMQTLAQELTATGGYIAVLLSVEVGAIFNDNPEAAEHAILNEWSDAIQYQLPADLHPSTWQPNAVGGRLIGDFLGEWASAAPLPLVIFLDEIDALHDKALISIEGHLNPTELLNAFLTFWRQHGQPLLKSAPYHEIAPHLVMMAFLHRVVNGGGTWEREYAIGNGRMDLCLRYGDVTLGIELKVWHPNTPDPQTQGLKQLDNYLAGLNQNSGWLVIFDRRPHQPPISQRTYTITTSSPSGREVIVIYA